MTKTRDLADLGGGFIQAGTGAVQRTVESKLQDMVSVKDFGAVGDGVTDDTAAIQAALTATQSNLGGTVIIPPGEYRVTSTLTAGNGVQLIGLGTEFSTKIRVKSDFTGNEVLSVVNGSSLAKGVQIKNLRVQMLTAPDGTDGIVLYSAYDRCVLENVIVDGMSPDGRGIVFTNNPLYTTFKVSQDISLRNCQVFKADGTAGTGIGHCFDFYRCNEFSLENCRANGNNGSPTINAGFNFVNCYGGTLVNPHAHGNKYGIKIEETETPEGQGGDYTWNSGITILGPTYESTNGAGAYSLYISGTATRTASKVWQENPRYVDGASFEISKTYLEYARWCHIDCGKTNRTPALEIGPFVQDCTFKPLALSKVSGDWTDNILILDSPISDKAAWNLNGYGCILNKDVAQTITTGTPAPMTWGLVVKDDYGFYDEITDNTRITIPASMSGTYLISASVSFDADATGVRDAQLSINGNPQQQGRTVINNSGGGSVTVVLINTAWDLDAGDYIQILANHNNGTTLDLSNNQCRLAIHKIQ